MILEIPLSSPVINIQDGSVLIILLLNASHFLLQIIHIRSKKVFQITDNLSYVVEITIHLEDLSKWQVCW
jgi:hypothetical protein